MDFEFLASTFVTLVKAVPTTLALFGASVVLGAALAVVLVVMRTAGGPILSTFSRVYVFIFRGSPLLIQMFLIYYGLGQFAVIRDSFAWPVLREPYWCAVLALAFCTAGYQAEIIRGGLQAVPPREIEAARSIGMSGFLLVRRIIAPITLRAMLPAYSTEIILMVKSTALASLVTVWEVTGTAQRLISQTYRTMEVFLVATLIYLVINFIIVRLVALLEHRLSPHLRERPRISGEGRTVTSLETSHD
ncbi:octopine/nopaline transport system permease protein [Rhodopseudomonas julia]|uniref:Octopine/nopaline transport system permease protein n=1 Tax=Rhodopseudomonas julia TaxID=200617 RepID=A0ABU0C160_9BRAD|nr:ABC transporter permease [Rhodopseudomonas julia]MDQ0324258.1 octopine/nopaline transport system permease protein [Rhodopseudomonas julia]